ncbi:MAG TPA: NFACT RNA binding domain-containing protein [Polyangiaceae bacterium]|jgi:predicted ribosome quality control (RQC) complex YloA/Tae2 family protein
MAGDLSAGYLQKVRVARLGAREVALLELRVPGETRHVVVAEGLGAGLLGPAERARLKEAMAGAVKPGAAYAQTLAERAARGLEGVEPEERLARGARIVEEVARGETGGRRDALRRALAKATARVTRRIEAVRGDLSRAEGADAMAQRAQLFVAEAGRASRGAAKLVAVDWSTGEPKETELTLDPSRSARAQIDALFTRARRLKEGARIGRTRLAEAEKALAALADVARALAGDAEPDPTRLAALAREGAPRDFKLAQGPGGEAGPLPGARSAKPGALQPELPPYRTFATASGARILVGRAAEKNDALTFHVARPHDLWLHAKNRRGAHVVVPLDKNTTCPGDVLVDAAHLAAHFSEARGEAVVEVQYTPRRYLRKPRGAAAGLVVVDREKVLLLRLEEGRLRALLERETE